MAIGPINTSFLESNWALWDNGGGPGSGAFSVRTGPLPGYGCGGGPSNTCNNGVGDIRGDLQQRVADPAGVKWTQLLIKMQFGLFSNINFDSIVPYNLMIQHEVIGATFLYAFVCTFRIKFDGTINMIFTAGDGAAFPALPTAHDVYYSTAPGTFPTNGSLQAIQILINNLVPTSVGFAVTLNNVTVLSGTHFPTGFRNDSYGYFTGSPTGPYVNSAGLTLISLAHYRETSIVGGGTNDLMTNCAQFIASNSGTLGSYANCSAPIKIDQTTCFTSVPAVTDMVMSGSTIVVTGTGLGCPTVTLTGPGSPTFTKVCISDTEIDLTNVSPGTTGTYTVTVGTLPPFSKLLTEADKSGIYFINPTKTHETYNGPIDKKIPDPTIKSALIGE